MKFNICKAGTNEVIFGMAGVGLSHAQLMMLVPVVNDVVFSEMKVGQTVTCRDRINELYTVVRVE